MKKLISLNELPIRHKKIIAREGLIFVCSLLFWFVFNFILLFKGYVASDYVSFMVRVVATYLVGSFIVWAIKTLREKEA